MNEIAPPAATKQGSRTLVALPSRVAYLVIPVLVLTGIAAGATALFFTGAAETTKLADPGPIVKFGLPAAKFIFNLAMSLTLGALMFALLILPRTQGRGGRRKSTDGASEPPLEPLWEKSLKIAEVSSVVWTISAVAVLVFSFVDTVGAQAYLDFSNQLGVFLTQIAYGQLWVLIVVLIAVASTLCFGTWSFLGIAAAGVLGVGVMIPLALMGHSAEASGHTQAVNSLGLHLLGVTVWLGGLFVIALLGTRLARSSHLRTVVERYSNFALVSFGLVAFSGVVNSLLRVHSLDD